MQLEIRGSRGRAEGGEVDGRLANAVGAENVEVAVAQQHEPAVGGDGRAARADGAVDARAGEKDEGQARGERAEQQGGEEGPVNA
jgi:hypothetical protein